VRVFAVVRFEPGDHVARHVFKSLRYTCIPKMLSHISVSGFENMKWIWERQESCENGYSGF